MSTMKRSVSLLLVLCVMLVVVPVTAHAATGGSCGENVTWSLSDDGVLTISGTGPMEDYDVDYAPWFDNLDLISSVKIENGVTTIGAYAFEFSDITDVEIPDSVTSIGQGAFGYCIELGNVEIPDSVTIIGGYAFAGSTNLTSVEIPGNVTTIGESAFRGCESLSSVKFYGNAPEIGEDAFLYVTATAYYPANNPTWTAEVMDNYGGNLTWVPYGSCGDNLTWTLDDAGTLTISGTGKMSYFSEGTSPWHMKRTSVKTVVIEDGVTSIGNSAFYGCISLTEITIPEGVTSIGDDAFYDCSSLTEITIPEGVTSIGEAAFYGCSSLTEIIIPEGVTSIGEAAFSGCSSLTEITIPEGVTSIGEAAFSGCSSLTEITIPEGVSSIGDGAYYGCSSLTDVYYGGTESEWNDLDNTPNATRIHYDCSSAEGHWMVHGKLKVCDCGYIAGENPFTDVNEGDFFYDPVMWAVVNGVTTGATENTFDPNGSCLRAHVGTFLHRAAGNPEPSSTNNPFTDVASGSFFYKPVLWAVEEGITNGTSPTTFGAYNNCNRAAVVTFLWRAAESPEPTSTTNPFVDVATDAFYYKAVLWAVENGITNGVDATHFGPTANCTRGQVVTFLYRTYKP